MWEIPKNLVKGEKNIAEGILNSHKNIKSVFKKKGAHFGTFRTQKLKLLAGKNNKETIHKEHNCQLKLDVEKVYFSPRLSNERKRIFLQVKPKEKEELEKQKNKAEQLLKEVIEILFKKVIGSVM